jgi:hypothetical protein
MMTSLPPCDPLVSLWQTAPKPDTQHLLQDLRRLNRLHQRLNRIVFAIMCSTAVLLIFEEATGRVTTHGTLSVIWILGLVLGVVWHRRARCNRSDAITLDTVSLLNFMIARAKRDLRIARCLYAGVPCGAVAGFFAAKLAGIGGSPNAIAVPPHLHLIETGAHVAALVAMMVLGVILARSRRHQVQELSEKLRSIRADL